MVARLRIGTGGRFRIGIPGRLRRKSQLWARNSMIRLAPLLSRLGVLGVLDPMRGAFEALVLPDFDSNPVSVVQ